MENTGTEIIILKSPRKKIAEAILYVWGVFGMLFCLYLSRQVTGADVLSLIMYATIWTGGLVFIGFFVITAPIRIFLQATGEVPFTSNR